jgi:hypothetical protein
MSFLSICLTVLCVLHLLLGHTTVVRGRLTYLVCDIVLDCCRNVSLPQPYTNNMLRFQLGFGSVETLRQCYKTAVGCAGVGV